MLSFRSICATSSFRVVPTDCIYGVDRKDFLAVWADTLELNLGPSKL